MDYIGENGELIDPYSFEGLLIDLKKRDQGVIFGKKPEGKEKALAFKEYARENDLIVHVTLDDRKNWYVLSEKAFNSVNESFAKWNKPPLKSYV